MKFAVASYGTRGDIEPCAAVGLELPRRGHEVRMAVPPNLIGFVEAAGLSAAVPTATGTRSSSWTSSSCTTRGSCRIRSSCCAKPWHRSPRAGRS